MSLIKNYFNYVHMSNIPIILYISNLAKVMRDLVPNLPDLNINKFTHRQTFANGLKALNTSTQNIWNIVLLKRFIRKTACVILRSKLRQISFQLTLTNAIHPMKQSNKRNSSSINKIILPCWIIKVGIINIRVFATALPVL